ncbi:hypothetical protein [Alkaliphilus sp. B6464]|uniref:hypothetical protein n=1 Tax=Alkaliphilus sp. B6464 TaxID=2731219 RepID=UPI001BAB0D80|nr:hypothetical protein [Alkaliphilus sp. B6464]QUH21793.1 hypothetical protein HYG84_17815 [Alkaliphilus sp. B6464]
MENLYQILSYLALSTLLFLLLQPLLRIMFPMEILIVFWYIPIVLLGVSFVKWYDLKMLGYEWYIILATIIVFGISVLIDKINYSKNPINNLTYREYRLARLTNDYKGIKKSKYYLCISVFEEVLEHLLLLILIYHILASIWKIPLMIFNPPEPFVLVSELTMIVIFTFLILMYSFKIADSYLYYKDQLKKRTILNKLAYFSKYIEIGLEKKDEAKVGTLKEMFINNCINDKNISDKVKSFFINENGLNVNEDKAIEEFLGYLLIYLDSEGLFLKYYQLLVEQNIVIKNITKNVNDKIATSCKEKAPLGFVVVNNFLKLKDFLMDKFMPYDRKVKEENS